MEATSVAFILVCYQLNTFIMNRYARFHFSLNDGNPLYLTYLLQPNSLLSKWEQIIDDRTGDKLELKISNKTEKDLPELKLKLNEICKNINNLGYKPKLPLLESESGITKKFLNCLHEQFENYGDSYKSKTYNHDLHRQFLRLNEFIHVIEDAMLDTEFPQFHCLLQYSPNNITLPLTDEDKLFLDTNLDWGHLYLGYSTLGKDWNHVAIDDEKRCIIDGRIKVQNIVSSEVFLVFSNTDHHHKQIELSFWNWYKTLSVNLQKMIPIHNINKLSLGYYYLGQLVIDDTFLNFHNKVEDWFTPFSDARKRWNLEVFSKIEKVVDMQLFDENHN